jgi:hypothetical protein
VRLSLHVWYIQVVWLVEALSENLNQKEKESDGNDDIEAEVSSVFREGQPDVVAVQGPDGQYRHQEYERIALEVRFCSHFRSQLELFVG